MRSAKTGSALELQVMAGIARTLNRLPAEMRSRIVNWVSAQSWSDEQPKATQPAPATLS